MIEIRNGSKQFGMQVILHDVNLKISHPGLYVLWGESGCGKSTLMNIIAGYDRFDTGELIKDGTVMTVFQNYELIEELNVEDNIFLGASCTEENRELLEKLKIDDLGKRFPAELSGGQKQRVGIARALISEPRMICCDEPTESLDNENRDTVMELLKEYSVNHIVILATHRKEIVEQYADSVIEISDKKLACHDMNCTNGVEPPERQIHVNETTSDILVKKIIKKSTRRFSVMFALLLLLSQTAMLVKQVLFYEPDEQKTLNADYVYIRCSDRSVMYDLGLTDAEHVLNFMDLRYDDKDWKVNILPYPGNTKNLTVSGNEPEGTGILLNSNAAEALFDGDWENRTLPLTFLISPYIYDLDMEVTGVIEETDTNAMNIYYSLSGMEKYLKTVEMEDETSLYSYFQETEDDYQYYVGYEEIDELMESSKGRRSIRISSPYYEEKQSEKNKSRLFSYLFTGMILIVDVVYSVFVYITAQKDTFAVQKPFAILISRNINPETVRKQFMRHKLIPVVVIVIADAVLLAVLQLTVSKVNVILPVILAGVELIIYGMSLAIGNRKLKEENISTILKE